MRTHIRTSMTTLIASAVLSAATIAGAQTPTQNPPQAPRTPPQTTPPAGEPKTTPAKPTTPGTQNAQAGADARFMKMVAQDGRAEIELADLANAQSQNADVKALATKIKTDHTKANEELQQIASGSQVTLPSEVTPAQKATHDRLAKLNGAAFDKAYIAAMVKDHQAAVAAFTKESKTGTGDVKAFAEKTLPALQDHLQRSQTLQRQLNGGK